LLKHRPYRHPRGFAQFPLPLPILRGVSEVSADEGSGNSEVSEVSEETLVAETLVAGWGRAEKAMLPILVA
jgi:hypothetical protein